LHGFVLSQEVKREKERKSNQSITVTSLLLFRSFKLLARKVKIYSACRKNLQAILKKAGFGQKGGKHKNKNVGAVANINKENDPV
jgi:hypothetical protein